MAGNSIRISTDQVEGIATELENLNNRLEETLTNSKNTIDNLQNIWTGEAAQETISSFDSFAGKYFQSYKDIIQQYVTFLRQNVAAGYLQTENANINLASAFK